MKIKRMRTGWAAVGEGWAVFGDSRKEAIEKFEDAERKHREIDARPLPEPEVQSKR